MSDEVAEALQTRTSIIAVAVRGRGNVNDGITRTMRRMWLATAAGVLLLLGPFGVATARPGASAQDLVVTTTKQDSRFATAFAEVDAWVARSAFPGAVVAVGQHGRLLVLKPFGRIDSSPVRRRCRSNALFDLASLTKVVGTTTAAEILYDRHQLDLDAPVVRYLPEFGAGAGHDRITVRDLLTHSSGLKPSGLLWQHASDRQGILRQIDAMAAPDAPGTAFRYQDINMILMGEIVERCLGPAARSVPGEGGVWPAPYERYGLPAI